MPLLPIFDLSFEYAVKRLHNAGYCKRRSSLHAASERET